VRGRLLLLVVIGGLSFSNSLGGPFHYDDLHSVQYNPHIRSLSWIPTFYVDPSTFSGQARGFMYRPLLLTTFASDYALWGQNATAFRVGNLAIHIAAAAAFGVLSYLLLRSTLAATVISLIFLVHPLHGEVVNYISARSDSLMALLFVVCCICALKGRSHAVGIGYAASLMVKSVAITLGPMFVMLRGWGGAVTATKSKFMAGAVVLLSIGYLAVLWSTRFLSHSAEVFPRAPTQEIWTQVKGLVYYVWLFASPIRLSVDHPFSVGAATDPAVIMAITVVLSAVGLSWRHRLSVPGLAAIWYGVAILPYVFLPLNVLVAERRAYLAMAGGMLLAGWAWHRLYERRRSQASYIGMSLLVCLVVLTMQRNQVWASGIGLWSDAVEKNQASARAQVNLSLALRRAGRADSARRHLREGLRLDPEFAEGWVIAGDMAKDLGEWDTARSAYERAAQIQPTMEGVHHNLGNLAYAEGRVDDAIRAFRRTLELNPRFAEARNNLGQALEARGRDEEALAEYERAVQDAEFWIHTDDPVGGAWYNLARIADRLDRPSQAIDAYRQTIQHLQGGDEYSRFVEFARKRVVSLADGGAR